MGEVFPLWEACVLGSNKTKLLHVQCSNLNVLEHKRMITNLSQLHDGVHQSLSSSTTLS